MPARDRWDLVPFEPTPDQMIRIGWISAALGFLIAIVSAIGELAGWWDLLGAVGIGVGSLLGIVATFATLSFTAGREQVRDLQGTMQGVEDTVEANNTVLSENNEILSDASVTLDGIEDALVHGDGEASKLDVVQAELDRQTGVLDRQVELLGAIRDRL